MIWINLLAAAGGAAIAAYPWSQPMWRAIYVFLAVVNFGIFVLRLSP